MNRRGVSWVIHRLRNCLRPSNTVVMLCEPTDWISPQIVLNVTVLAHSGYEDGECVAIKRRGVGGVVLPVLFWVSEVSFRGSRIMADRCHFSRELESSYPLDGSAGGKVSDWISATRSCRHPLGRPTWCRLMGLGIHKAKSWNVWRASSASTSAISEMFDKYLKKFYLVENWE